MKKTIALLILLYVATFAQQKGTFTDARDGKKYKTVKIGTQTWMAENLNYASEGSRCYEDKPANCNKYGRLYNWHEAMEACPKGWHLPSADEWHSLRIFTDGSKNLKTKSGWEKCKGKYEAGPMRDAYGRPMVDQNGRALMYYTPYDNCGTDKYGFSALSGGRYYFSNVFFEHKRNGDVFSEIGYSGYWWESADEEVARMGMDFFSLEGLGGLKKDENDLVSVRCLRD